MAIDQNINVKVNAQQAKKEFEALQVVIQDQEEYLARTRVELARLNQEYDNTSNYLKKQALGKKIKDINNDLKVESATLKELQVKAKGYNDQLKSVNKSKTTGKIKAIEFNESLLKNEDITSGLSTITGGYASKVKNLGRLFISTTKGLRVFVAGLSTLQKALLATGVGAIAVGIGLLVANFDKIKQLVTGINPEIEKLENNTNKIVESSNEEITLLEKQKELYKLQGKEVDDINEKLLQTFKLQKENLLLLLEQYELQLNNSKEQDKQVSFWESIKIGIAAAFKPTALASEYTKAITNESEQTSELQNKIKETKSKILDLDIKIARTNKTQADEEEKKTAEIQKQQDLEFDELNKFLAKKEQLEQIYFDSFLSQQQIEKNAVQDKYFALIQEAQKYNEDTTILEAARQTELNAIDDKFKLQAEEKRQKEIDDLAKLEERKQAIRNQAFDNAAKLAGEESRLGKAILVAKTILAAKENILEAKKTLTKAKGAVSDATIDAAKSGTAIAKGSAETAKVGFPQNIPLLLAYAAQAVGVVAAIKAAVSKTKQVASSVGASGGGGAEIQAPQITTAAPAFNIVGSAPENQLAQTIAQRTGQPVKAYVVAGDVTTAQGLDRNIIQESALG